MSAPVMVSVTEILRTVRYSCDFWEIEDDEDQRTRLWLQIIEVKSQDTGFGHLVESILTNGWDPESTIGWDPESCSIREGHHRLVAAILLGMDEVPTTACGADSSTGGKTLSAHVNHADPYPIDLAA